jgi:hypothetical protein
VIVRQVLYHLKQNSMPLFCFFFSDIVSHFCLGSVSDCHLSHHALQIADITGMYHHTWLICCDGILLTFFASNSLDYRQELLFVAWSFVFVFVLFLFWFGFVFLIDTIVHIYGVIQCDTSIYVHMCNNQIGVTSTYISLNICLFFVFRNFELCLRVSA